MARPSRRAYPTDDAFQEAEVLAAQDRKLLAMDVVKMLLPPSLDAIPQTSLVISDAVRATHGSAESSLWDVVSNLESLDEEHGRVVANYLRDMAELPLARLFFPSGERSGERLDATLTVLTMPGLVLPPRNVPRDHWSTSEQLAVRCCTWRPGTPPAPSTAAACQPEARRARRDPLPRRVVRRPGPVHPAGADSRKWNTCVLAASQNPADVLGMDVANFMSAAFVGRIEDDDAARDGLRMLRVPTGVGYERALATLSAGRGAAGFREFVMRDVDGHVDKIRVDLAPTPPCWRPSTPPRRPHGRRRCRSRDPPRTGWHLLALGLLMALPSSATSSPVFAADLDCKESPTPDMPGQGLAGFFQKTPDPLPPQADPSLPARRPRSTSSTGSPACAGAPTTWAAGRTPRPRPDAIIGTAISNWMLNLPISLTALTASVTEVAFKPTFLNVFDPAITRVSTALHDSLFATWVPAVIALLGIMILLKSRGRPWPPPRQPSAGH